MNITDEFTGDWESLWGATFAQLTPEQCDVAGDEAIDYAVKITGSSDAEHPENRQRQTYYEMGWRLGFVGVPRTRTVSLIQDADIGTWAEDDYVLDGMQAEAVIAGWRKGNIQACIDIAQKTVAGQGNDAYEESQHFVFAAVCRLANAYIDMGGDDLDGTLQAIWENLYYTENR
jgi:hypothetical protein